MKTYFTFILLFIIFTLTACKETTTQNPDIKNKDGDKTNIGDTMKKIQKRLKNMGINTHLVYGGTDVAERQSLIDNFKNGLTMVMVSNPQTLGEAVSLHETVHDAVYFEYNFSSLES